MSDVLIYREGIAAGLVRLGDLAVVGAVSSTLLASALRRNHVQIVMIDISHPDSRECARTARDLSPDVHIIGFGMTSDDDGLAGAEAGVTAFVDHDGTIEDLNDAAKRALSGLPVCPPHLTSRLLERIVELAARGRQLDDGASNLTHREREIALLVQEGLSNKEIAGALNISPATVKNHVHIILDKLNLPRRRMIGLAPQGRQRTARGVCLTD